MSLRDNLNVLAKVDKTSKLFPFQYKMKLEKLINMPMKMLQLYIIIKQNLFIVQDLWQIRYLNLLRISQRNPQD